jgi:yecA family protein
MDAYMQLERLLRQDGAVIGAAEAHGMLCGLLCGVGTPNIEVWIRQLLGDDQAAADLSQRSVGLLKALAEDCQRMLESGQMDFVLLLPGDEEPLADRVEALADWCQGFLFGLGSSRPRDSLAVLTADEREVLEDLSQISKVDVDEEVEEVQESAYMELTEYVRVAVQTLYDEFAAQRQDDSPGSLKLH